MKVALVYSFADSDWFSCTVILKNLLNNIDICNERYLKEGEIGYMIQRDVYIKELTEMKTMIKRKEKINMYK